MNKITSFLFILLIVLIPVTDSPYLPSYDTLRTCLWVLLSTLLLGCILFSIIRKGEWSISQDPTRLAISTFFVVNLLSVFVAINPWDSVFPLINLLCGLFLYWYVTHFVSRAFAIRTLFIILVAVSFLLSAYGVLQGCFGYDPLWQKDAPPENVQAISMFGNVDYASTFIAIVLPLIFALCFLKTRGWTKAFFIFTAAVLVVHALLTNARGGWAGAAVALPFAGIAMLVKYTRLHGWTRTVKWILGSVLLEIVLVGIIILSIPRFRDRVQSTFNPQDTTRRVRLEIWKSAWRMTLQYPFLGVGVGNFEIAFQPYRSAEEFKESNGDLLQTRGFNFVEDAHNMWVQIFSETGFLGLLFFLWILYIAFRRWLFYMKHATDFNHVVLLCGIAGGIVGFLVAGCFNSLIARTAHSFLFWLLLGLNERIGNERPRVRPVILQERLLAVGVTLFFTSIFLNYYMLQHIRAEWYGGNGEGRVRTVGLADNLQAVLPGGYTVQQYYEQAKIYLEQAQELNPHRWKTSYVLGNVYKMLGQTADAEREYRATLQMHPNYVPAMINLSQLLLERGVKEEAKQWLEKAINVAPVHFLLYFNLGGFYHSEGNLEKARFNYQKAVECEPDFVRGYLLVGDIYMNEGKPAEAQLWYARAKEQWKRVKGKLKERINSIAEYQQMLSIVAWRARLEGQ